jgi:hypothetical protein
MDTKQNRSSVIIGTLLLAAGLFILFGQLVGPLSRGVLWPTLVIGFGLAFFIGMLLGGRSFGALAIPGSIITGIGAILFLQNLFSLWETWSYAWALIICSVGIGLFIYGSWSSLPDIRRSGLRVANVGITLFIIFGLLFELVFSVSGFSTGLKGIFWPIILVLVGLWMLISRSVLLIRGGGDQGHTDLNLFWPVIFIGAGILWLFVRQNILTTSQLSVIINFWPILLIAAGVNIILGRRFQWVNLILGVLVVLGVFYVVINNSQLGFTPRTPWGIFGVDTNGNTPVTQWIAGSGKIAEQNREVGDIRNVNLRGSGELEVIQGSQNSLKISAEDNLLPYITTETSGDTLNIAVKPGIGFTTTRPVHFTLTVKELDSINVSGAASVQSKKIQADHLQMKLSGFGDIVLNGITAKSLTIGISGSGNVKLDGSADELDASISGAGSLNSANLKTNKVVINISGVGQAVVWAVTQLEPSISGIGRIAYYGNPQVIKQTSGIGTVQQLGGK